MVNGLVTPSSGAIRVNGKDIKAQPLDELRRQIGYVLQRNSLFPHYTVEENISVVPYLLKWDRQTIRQRVRELMKKLHLPEKYLSRTPDELSGGEAQRVNIARALAADPPILLMDEPFSALDAINRKSIRQEVMQLEEFRKKTIIIVSHDIQEAFELGDTIALLQHGQLVQKARPTELLYHPTNDFVKEFLSKDFLQLSLGSTSIAELWHHVGGEAIHEEQFSKEPYCDTNLWNAMELFRAKMKDCHCIRVRNQHSGAFKHVTWAGLMNAYHSLQCNNANER